MRTFYIYNINDSFTSMYEEYPYKLYKMLEDAYLTNKNNHNESIRLYKQIITNYNKLFMNNYIFANNKLDISYYHKEDKHLITNSNEHTKLEVNRYYLKIKTNINYPKFFDNINFYSDNIFICDYANNDYFWLNKVKDYKNNYIKQ
ncbi:MAG: sporulation inhibitor of replication protein SirA [Bacilli bacterium]|nr:sporulation inhibitor of replication protein SirA [Bacilli bacterium]